MFICGICGKKLKQAGSHPATHKLNGKVPWNKGITGCYNADILARMSAAQKDRFQRMDTPNKGIPHTKESNEKNRLAHLGKSHPMSKEARMKISESRKGKPRPPHVRKILAEANRKRLSDPEFIEKMRTSRKVKPTSIEKKFMSICQEHKLPFRYVGNGEVWIARKNPDFINIDGKKQVIEVLGNYWHNEEETQKRIKHYAKYGFECIPIWENDLKDIRLVLSKLGEL